MNNKYYHKFTCFYPPQNQTAH